LRGTGPSGPYQRAGLGHRVTLKRRLRCPCCTSAFLATLRPMPWAPHQDRNVDRHPCTDLCLACAKNIRCFWRKCERSALFLHCNMWDIAIVKFWPLLPRLLSILAVVSLLIAPMAAPSVAMAAASVPAMEDMASMTDGMPCCSHEKPALPDCPNSCPLAALCMAGCLPYAPVSGASVPARFAVADVKSPSDDVGPERLTEPPPPRPPRT
jgi:hypothetical protein